MRWLFLYAAALCLAVSSLPVSAHADTVDKEYLVKAALIYKFPSYINWPAARAIANQASVDICVLGDSPLRKTTTQLRPPKPFNMVGEKNWSAVAHCHIVFVSSSEEGRLGDLSALHTQSILTVSDVDGFAEQGGMIEFVIQDGKVKLIVNLKAISDAGLRVDPQLLKIALKVIDR